MRLISIIIGLLALVASIFVPSIGKSQFTEEMGLSSAVSGVTELENYEATGFTSHRSETDIREHVLNASGDPWEVPGASASLRGNGMDLSAGASKRQLLQAMEGHILGRGELMGKYRR